jgi:DNA (cytosine-5)-methyltransferase 1
VAYGIPGRVVTIKGYGDAIVPQTAALFIRAFMGVVNIGVQNET